MESIAKGLFAGCVETESLVPYPRSDSNRFDEIGSQTITVDLYSILDFSKQLVEYPHYDFVSKTVLERAMWYAAGVQDVGKAMECITQGMWAENIYEDMDHQYAPGGGSACAEVAVNYKLFFGDASTGAPVRMNCWEAANIINTFSRALGMETSMYGLTGPFVTNEVMPMGGKVWRTFEFDFHQTDQFNTNIHDATLAFKKGKNQKEYAINLPRLYYGDKLVAGGISGSDCPIPGAITISY